MNTVLLHKLLEKLKCIEWLLEYLDVSEVLILSKVSKILHNGLQIYRTHLVGNYRILNFNTTGFHVPSYTHIDTITSSSPSIQNYIDIKINMIQKFLLTGCVLYLNYDSYKGYNVHTRDIILPNTFLMIYTGEMIRIDEVNRREQFQQESKLMNYILMIKEHMISSKADILTNQKDRIICTNIDAQYYGGLARFLNHSCDPNLELVMIHKLPDHIQIPNQTSEIIDDDSIFNMIGIPVFRSIHLIAPSDELTFHYGAQYGSKSNDNDNDNNIYDILNKCHKRQRMNQSSSSTQDLNTTDDMMNRKVCYCGSSNCEGFLPYTRDNTLDSI